VPGAALSFEHRARTAVTTMGAVPPRPAVKKVGVRSGSGAMLDTCGSAGKGMKEGAPSRMIE
jgi:hypothetical protein